MVLSLLAVGVVVAVVYVFVPHSGGDPVKVIDYRSAVVTARRAAPYPIQAPRGLPARWRPTSVEYHADDAGHATWHLGFVTPSDSYAAVEQTDDTPGALVADQVANAAPDGRATVDGRQWLRYRGSHYRALVRRADGASTAVVGTASFADLARLAGALRNA